MAGSQLPHERLHAPQPLDGDDGHAGDHERPAVRGSYGLDQ